MTTTGYSVVQALVLFEPIKFALMAFIIACMPSKTKKRCLRCMQSLAICGPLVIVLIGTSITAIMEGAEVEDVDVDMEMNGGEGGEGGVGEGGNEQQTGH